MPRRPDTRGGEPRDYDREHAVDRADHTELFKQFSDNPSFKKWLGDTIFGATYQEQGGQAAAESAAESHGR